MNNIVHLRIDEQVQLDRDQLEVLLLQLGASGADKMVAEAMEEMAILLATVERRHREGKMDDVSIGVKGLVGIAQQVGMTTLARVGRDVLSLIHSYDSAAYCAAVARMVRIGESSLVAVWDMQGMQV